MSQLIDFFSDFEGTDIAEGHCDINDWLLLEIILFSSVKGKTKQMLTEVWKHYLLIRFSNKINE